MAFQSISSNLQYILGRETGRQAAVGTRDWMFSSLYSSFKTSAVTHSRPHKGQDWGAVFGLGFSPDGKLMTAACEHRCMMMYDPLNAQLITRRFDTHDDCVNCVRFLDNRIFATCSDDNTVRLWDSRFLVNELKILRGHSSWVKNIEYAASSGKLVTSGFDGNIFAWDIDNFTSDDFADPVFYINGAMRTKLSHDESKLLVSTLGGYFLLIHDLDLDHLKEDLSGFKPHLYRLMQLMNTPLHHALQYNYMFTRKRNRVEFMCDFPDSDNAESIATMQIHPHDWCVVSRNTTLDEETEWTCVHDIQCHGQGSKEELGMLEADPAQEDSDSMPSTEAKKQRRSGESHPKSKQPDLDFFSPMWVMQQASRGYTNNLELALTSDSEDNVGEESEEEAETTILLSLASRPSEPQAVSLSSQSRLTRASTRERRPLSNQNNTESQRVPSDVPDSTADASSSSSETEDFPAMPLTLCSRWRKRRMAISHHEPGTSRPIHTEQLRIRNIRPRLLYYTEEPNVGKGFIKEQSFSHDGRVIASPFGNSVRLLAFDPRCRELFDNVPTSPQTLSEVASCAYLKSNILATAFSPAHSLLVAGAVDGSLAFSHPVL